MNNIEIVAAAVLSICATIPAAAGQISPPGSAIEVENYRCEVTSPFSIECRNIGRFCAAIHTLQKLNHDATFGCAIKGEKTYPCPPRKEPTENDLNLEMACMTTRMGGF